jgi:F-type H+-transporting ATPase subunit b
MDEVLRSLGGLMLEAVPTFVLILLLHFYLKRVFFRPMARTLAERYEATEGARKRADESLAKAKEKAAEYEAALRAARGDIYREQEEYRKQLRQDQAAAIQEARQRSQATVKEAAAQLAVELATAKQTLARQTDTLAGEIVAAVLHRRTV